MNKKRLWAPILSLASTSVVLALGLTVALPAGAQDNSQNQGFIPSMIPDDDFEPWPVMYAGSFFPENSAAVNQCKESVGYVEGLMYLHCDKLAVMLEEEQCEVVQVPDGERYRYVRGRDAEGISKLIPNLYKALDRNDRALRCKLAAYITVDWFTGVKGQSCNNLGFLYIPPPMLLPVVENEYFYGDSKVFFSDPVNYSTSQYLDTFNGVNPNVIQNCPDFKVGSFEFKMDSNVQSNGYYNQ